MRYKHIISAIALNISEDDIKAEIIPDNKDYIIPFFLNTISLAYLLFQMVTAYRNIENWVHKSLTIVYSFLYASSFLFIVAITSALFLWGVKGFGKRVYLGIVASLPIFIISLISIIMKISLNIESIGSIRVLGHFPEHPLIIGAYLLIFSHTRLVSIFRKTRAVLYLFLLSVLSYLFLGPVMFKLFNL